MLHSALCVEVLILYQKSLLAEMQLPSSLYLPRYILINTGVFSSEECDSLLFPGILFLSLFLNKKQAYLSKGLASEEPLDIS